MKTALVIGHISEWLKNYSDKAGTKGFVIGISGGVDSAVTSALCARTGLAMMCVEMPIHQHASQVERGREHIQWLKGQYPKVSQHEVDLTPVFDEFVRSLPVTEQDTGLALANARARLRMTTLYYFAGLHSLLVAGTGNKVEDFGVGFFTKYGDGGVDLSPIADLTKTEVYDVARELGIIESIQKAAPTDGLWGDSRSDEDQIGASYPELEEVMKMRAQGVIDLSGLDARQQEVLAIYDRLHAANRHKMIAIPVCEVPPELRRS